MKGKTKEIKKIIYFDRETIANILQEQNKGSKQTQTEMSTSSEVSADTEAEANVKLSVPLALRLSFLFTGRIGAKFLIKRESETMITSTEISEFDIIKSALSEMKSVRVSDVENSLTSFRVAGNLMRFVRGQVKDIDISEFNSVMNSFEGYDTYKIDDDNECYVRFNNSAFVSNYKGNDLLSTQMTLYCIKVGEFEKSSFDFMKQINKMQEMFSNAVSAQTLADIYPPKDQVQAPSSIRENSNNEASDKTVSLYDVVYACISLHEEKTERETR
jgi:hypothetical protein